MTKVLLVAQDKGGTAKTLSSRGLAEVVPGAPLIEIDASPRMIELGKRVKFFQMRADICRSNIVTREVRCPCLGLCLLLGVLGRRR
jgi:hypothetical protein